MYFYKTTRGQSNDANALWEYSLKFGSIKGSPALVWIDADGKAVRGRSGFTTVKDSMQDTLTNGYDGWWNPQDTGIADEN